MPNIPKKEFYVLQDLVTSGWDDYELLDSGDQKKLERFGHYQLVRFEPEAIWKPAESVINNLSFGNPTNFL